MKKFLFILIVIAGLGGAGYYYGDKLWTQYQFSQVVKPMYADIIKNNWEKDTIKKYASPDLNKWLATPESDVMLKAFADLGQIKKYKGVFSVKQSIENEQQAALVKVIIIFDKGPHRLPTGLVKKGDTWLITGFTIETYQLND